MIRRSTLLDLCFFGIAFIIFSNLNGMTTLIFGVTAPFSSFILAFCLIITFYLFRHKKLTLPHYALNFVLIWLLVVGIVMWMFYSHGYHKDADFYRIFRKQAPGVLLLYAVYKYMIYAADRGKLINVLYLITFTLLIATLTLPFSSLIGGNFRALVYGGGRSGGLFGQPNLAGIHVNFTLAFILFFVLNSKRFFLFFLACVPIVLYAGFLTFSKAAIVTQILIIVLFFLYNFYTLLKIERLVRRRFLFSVLVIISATIYFLPEIKEYTKNLQYTQLKRLNEVKDIFSGKINAETTTDRSILWKEAIVLIIKQPFIGYGTGSFHKLPEGGLGTHNTYLVVWGEGGILALMGLLFFIFSSLYRAYFWIKKPSYRFLVLVLLVVIIIQMYGSSHNGLKNSEVLCMTAILFAIIEAQRGNIGHLRYGKYAGKDYRHKETLNNRHVS